MKTLFQIKETSASSVRHCCRVLSLIAILMAISASAVAQTFKIQGSSWLGLSNDLVAMTKVGDTHTWSFTATNTGNNQWFKIFKEGTSQIGDGNKIEIEFGHNYLLTIGSNSQFEMSVVSGVSYNIVITYTTGTTCSLTVTSGSGPTPTGDAPVVYWAAYPTMGMNTVNMYGHLHSRDCNTITGAGFYWSTSHINVDAAKAAIEAGTDEHIIKATSPSPASIGSLVAGGIFSAEGAEINLQESRSIYLVNYAKTAEGGIGISDEVALSYDYCDPMEEGDLTLNNTTVSLPKGAKFKFEAIAHNAGKSPVFEWKDGETVIEGATTNTLEYEMPDTQTHTITVTVLGRCGDEDKKSKSATVTLCNAAPSVAFGAEVLTATTPWVSVPITITATNVTSAEWSVTPGTAELSGLTPATGGYTGTFKAPVAAGAASTDYIIEVKGKNNTCTGSVEAVAQHKITVTKDEDTCDK